MRLLLWFFVPFYLYSFSIKDPASFYAVKNVTVIPMDKERIIKNQTVLIKDGKISHIGNAGSMKIPKSAVIINGKGKYIIPGLMDMHVHFFYEQGISKDHLPSETQIMIANGITTARIMNGDAVYLGLKKKIADGSVAGPELFVVSPQLVGQWPFRGQFFGEIVGTPEEAKAAVSRFKEEEFDAVKITFFIKPNIYDAITQAAKELNMKVTGHVGYSVKLPRALKAKQQIEHLDEFLEILLPDTTFNRGISVSGTNIWNLKAWETIDYLDPGRISSLVKMVKESGIYVTPTNHFLHSSFAESKTEHEIKISADFPYIPDTLLKERFEIKDIYWNDPPPEASRKKFVTIRRQITKALYDAGVPLMAGSDSPEWFLVQGFSLHSELEEFVKSGMSNYAALQTATINTAKYLGIDHRKGTIAAGKEADFVLLDKNPLEDIKNTRSINAVFAAKRFYGRDVLKEFLKKKKALQ